MTPKGFIDQAADDQIRRIIRVKAFGKNVVQLLYAFLMITEELVAYGLSIHIEDLLLFLYQRGLDNASGKAGTIGKPVIGIVNDGFREFLDQETLHDRVIQVRQVWSDITPTSYRFEQAISDDGGETWEVILAAKIDCENN